MTKFTSLISTVILTASLFAEPEEGFVSLFNGKSLEGWSTARATDDNKYGPFSVNTEEQAIHVYAGEKANSKQKTDVIYTDKEYSHFILKLEYKWVGKRFAPRTDWDRDSGLLFHIHGNLSKVWPNCLEMQIGESPSDKPNARGSAGRFHTGDLFVLGKKLRTDTKSKSLDGHKAKFYDPEGSSATGQSILTEKGVEKEGWNTMELHVHGSEKAIFKNHCKSLSLSGLNSSGAMS